MSAKLREDQVLLKNVRIGYPKIFTPEAVKGVEDGKERFGCVGYLPKDDEVTKARIDKIVKQLVTDKLNSVMPKGRDIFITDGDGEDGDENTEGTWVLSINRAKKQGRPQIISRKGSQLAEEDGAIYGGCRVNILFGIYVPGKWKKISASLEIVQFWEDDDPFGAPPADVSVMPGLGEDDENDDFDV